MATVTTVLVIGMLVLGIPFVDMKQRLGDLEQKVSVYYKVKLLMKI